LLKERGISIKEALDMSCFNTCKLIAGFGGYNSVITKVNVMADFEILDWINEGELLLTTAYFFKVSSLNEQLEFIKELSRKKLAGIAIKIYPYLNELSPQVINLANNLKLPIIELNYQIPFTDIMTPIFKEIFNKQVSMLQKVEDLHNELMNIIIVGGSVKDIVNTLSRIVNNPVFMVNHYFEDFIEDELLYSFDYETLKERMEDFFKHNINNPNISTKYSKKIRINENLHDMVMIPITVKNSIYAHIGVIALDKEISDFDIVSTETASTVIAIELIKRISIEEVENNHKAEFFQDLISLDKKRKDKAIDRAKYYKLDKNAYYSTVGIYLNKSEIGIDNEYDFNQYKSKVIYLINEICKDEKSNFLVTSKGKTINILLMWKDEKAIQRKIHKLVEKIDKAIEYKINDIKYNIGIGRIYKGLENVHKCTKDSEKALQASKTFMNEKIIDFDKLGIYKIFCQDNLKDELTKFYDSTLLPLSEYDKKRDTELVKTLEIYFQTNGNLKKMSEILFTHYNIYSYSSLHSP